MSVQASSWVIKNSKQKGSALLVMLMIANHAHSDGSNAFPGVKLLASECRMSERQITRIIATLEHTGELIVERSKGRVSHNYSIIMTLNPDKMSPVNPDKMSESTLTFPTPNPDISDTSTLTFPSFPIYKEEPSLEPLDNQPKTKTPSSIFSDVMQCNVSAFAEDQINQTVTDIEQWKTFVTGLAMQHRDKNRLYRNAMQKWILNAYIKFQTEEKTVPRRPTYENGKIVLERDDPRNPFSGALVL